MAYPAVSIIIRTYSGRWPVLKKAIASVLDQLYRPIELIVVEDGSTEMEAQLEKLSVSNGFIIRYLSQAKEGRSAAANLGLKKVEGEFVNFLDDDDILYPDHCDKLVNLLKRFPGASAAYGASHEVFAEYDIDKQEYHVQREMVFFNPAQKGYALLFKNLFPIQAVLFRSSICTVQDKFDVNLDALEDWLFWLRLLLDKKLAWTPEITSRFYVPADTNKRDERMEQHRSHDTYIQTQFNAISAERRISDLQFLHEQYLANLSREFIIAVSDKCNNAIKEDSSSPNECPARFGSSLSHHEKIEQVGAMKLYKALADEGTQDVSDTLSAKTAVFTSINLNSLPKALILAESLKQFHPHWEFHILLNDSIPVFSEGVLPNVDTIFPVNQLDIADFHQFAFSHSVVELCTATKAFYFRKLINDGYEKIFYFEPEVCIYAELSYLTDMLDNYDVIITPHCTKPGKSDVEVFYNEIPTLVHGIYNLGFLGIKNTKLSSSVIDFWCQRKMRFNDDSGQGLFTDQKWFNHIPVLFPETVGTIYHDGCNTASWNIAYRSLSERNSVLFAAEDPLLFFHFSGYDQNIPRTMFDVFGQYNDTLAKLISEYEKKNDDYSVRYPESANEWVYSRFDNDVKINLSFRKYFRSMYENFLIYDEPFFTQGLESFYERIKSIGMECIVQRFESKGQIQKFC